MSCLRYLNIIIFTEKESMLKFAFKNDQDEAIVCTLQVKIDFCCRIGKL